MDARSPMHRAHFAQKLSVPKHTLVSEFAAALPAERRVLARRGWAGEKAASLSILRGLTLIAARVRSYRCVKDLRPFPS